MIFRLAFRFAARGKTRFACTVAGIAAATAAAVFPFALSEANSAQAPLLAKRAAAPWAAWKFHDSRAGKPAEADGADMTLDLASCTADYRPGGRVMQGPPFFATIALAPEKNPFDSAPLAEGRWPDGASSVPEAVCAKSAFRRFGKNSPPAPGDEIKFVFENGTAPVKICGVLDDAGLPRGFPGFFANKAAFDSLAGAARGRMLLWEKAPDPAPDGLIAADGEAAAAAFKSDDSRRLDYARPLTIAAALLAALSLLANSLLVSCESNRREIAILRTAGMPARGACGIAAVEAAVSGAAGWAVGCAGVYSALCVWAFLEPDVFPAGIPVGWRIPAISFAAAVAVSALAALCAMRSALSVRPLDAIEARPLRRRRGMAVAFALGYAAFVAVEVWGASLMRAFVPSPEWPDAIVSLLPGGTDPFNIEKLRGIPGVKRISELYPLQAAFDPLEEMPARGGEARGTPPQRGRRGGPPRKAYRNALVLAAEFLPDFKFSEGSRECLENGVPAKGRCIVSEMVARAHGLHKGGKIVLRPLGRGGPDEPVELQIDGVVDVNWHMVTSRGLVRGMNGAPVMTDGPVFVSLATAEYIDPRPQFQVSMTHLWVEYEKDFLEKEGVFPAGDKIERRIAAALGDPPDVAVRLHARDEIADGTLARGSGIIGRTARVPFFFLAILSIGFIAAVIADAEASKRDFAVYRAAGATRAMLAGKLVKGALAVALKGIAWGLPIGAAAGWIAARRTGAIWPGLPAYFEIPWGIMAEGTAGALAFVLVFSVPAAWRAAGGRARRSAQ